MVADGTEFITVADAARLLKVSRITIHRWLKHGRLPAYYVGPRAVRIKRQDLERVVVPAHGAETLMPPGGERLTTTFADVQPLTEEQKRRAFAALADAHALGAEILARRGGAPIAESWPIIREAREERSEELA